MKNILLSCILFTFFVVGVNAQTIKDVAPPPSESTNAVMTFEDGSANTTLDFGTIAQSSDPLRRVKFTNTGTDPLVIKNARGSCGCTVPDWPKEPILAGESAYIDVRYDTKRLGKINKRVTITTNEASNHVISVVGLIEAVAAEESVPETAPSVIGGGK